MLGVIHIPILQKIMPSNPILQPFSTAKENPGIAEGGVRIPITRKRLKLYQLCLGKAGGGNEDGMKAAFLFTLLDPSISHR